MTRRVLQGTFNTRRQQSVARWLEVIVSGQLFRSGWPGFNLPPCPSSLNRFQTVAGLCASCHKKWCLAVTDRCHTWQMTNNATHCQQLCTDQAGGWTELQRLYSADDVADGTWLLSARQQQQQQQMHCWTGSRSTRWCANCRQHKSTIRWVN